MAALVELTAGSAEGVVVARMANNQRRNALGAVLVDELIDALRLAEEGSARVFVLRAQPGVRTWSAGHDVAELPPPGEVPAEWEAPVERLLRAVRSAPLPVLCAVAGGVWGAACDLVASCDLAIAASDATFAVTPGRLGVPYKLAGVSRLPAVLPPHLVKEMFFTAQPIGAATAYRHGLVNRVVAPEQLDEAVSELAGRVAALAPLVLRQVKAELAALEPPLPAADVRDQLSARWRGVWSSADYREGVAAFRERRPPKFQGY